MLACEDGDFHYKVISATTEPSLLELLPVVLLINQCPYKYLPRHEGKEIIKGRQRFRLRPEWKTYWLRTAITVHTLNEELSLIAGCERAA